MKTADKATWDLCFAHWRNVHREFESAWKSVNGKISVRHIDRLIKLERRLFTERYRLESLAEQQCGRPFDNIEDGET
jgi:hypothetical protein